MPDRDLRLLALDGGGVRGLSALMILEQLMEAVDPDAPPKPCDYFDMIGGTSTGGLIAIMLGRLRMSVADSIAAYLSLSDRIFRKTRHRVTVKGKIQGRFDSEELARAVREVTKEQGLQEDELLKDGSGSACKVFVCATSKETSETVCLTSYRSPRGNRDLLDSVKIWEACRATSAASSFFDPIAVGRFEEEFVDGATGANNPVREVWDQAQLVWGPEPLEDKIKCLVSIGTGMPSLKPFKDDVFHMGETLVAIATETEQTAEKFRRERSHLDGRGQYFRFNVLRGLEDIGLEESKKVKEMAAATRRYIGSQDVSRQMQACAGSVAGREYFGEYRTVFSLAGVPRVRQFVDRPAEMAELERVLLPRRGQNQRQSVHILRGLGGIGKTQLAVEFARRHQRRFSSVFWLDGRSEDSIKRSLASCASRIPQGQIAEVSRAYAADGGTDVDAVVRDVMAWLAQPDNTSWLLVIDNVDREYSAQGTDAEAYDVRRYLSGADHGSVLITTRLARLEQLGEAQQVGKVGSGQAHEIFTSWYKGKHDTAESQRLLGLLDGLPLAIAQAGAYLQESGVGLSTYLRFYEEQWDELMESEEVAGAPLQDYPDRSVWTTWAISYKAVSYKDKNTANLLVLWSFLDNKDLWHGLFAAACEASVDTEGMLSEWIGEMATSELRFSKAMQLLRSYSLVEGVEEQGGYATHPVVHRWAYHYRGKSSSSVLSRLAVAAVGWAVPHSSTRDYSIVQRRLLPHAQACSVWALGPTHTSALDTVNNLGNLYAAQGKLEEAEAMLNQALEGYKKALGPTHTSTLDMVNNLGLLYTKQGKLEAAEAMYKQALERYEKALGPTHTSTLDTVNNLGVLYADQGRLEAAEAMYKQTLEGKKKALGPGHTSTLDTVNNLGLLYTKQGKFEAAEAMYNQALEGYKKTLGPMHPSRLSAVNNLGNLYADQGRLEAAEAMYKQTLEGKKKALGPEHTSTLETVNNLGLLYADQGKLESAEAMLNQALEGLKKALGPTHPSTLGTVNNLGNLYAAQGKLEAAEAMVQESTRAHTHFNTGHGQ
ncbi:hypothetical protein BS50DRAFT_614817 [Corynespora cassiicola Philippines]|uniref:PNPLA domain-containing protein n=1 Tax=Corynespora cassiicola Philippines TaxID=1448308 RepID=A0A2T2MZG6_CORCC|nr:hypothetical protein BS50DRAFT_614817 [Corynespora cassiicola Philippines]